VYVDHRALGYLPILYIVQNELYILWKSTMGPGATTWSIHVNTDYVSWLTAILVGHFLLMCPAHHHSKAHLFMLKVYLWYSRGSSHLKGRVVLWPCPTPDLIRLLRSHCSSAAQLRSLTTYSGCARADTFLLSTSLGLCSIRSLPHLAVYPALTWVLRELDISYTL